MGLEIGLVWQDPIQLTLRRKLIATPESLIESIEKGKAGVYVFSRKHGKKYIPFYIGRSTGLRGRLLEHLKKNVALMKVVEGYGEEAKWVGQGSRYFQYAFLTSNVGVKRKLDIVERALIRKAIADDRPLLNKNNTKIEKHKIVSSGPKQYRAIFDRTTSIESVE